MWRLLYVGLLAPLTLTSAEPNRTNTVSGDLPAWEKRFQKTLENCVFNGRWCLVEKGKLTEEYHDKYTIQGVTKSGNGVWIVYARVQYGGKDLTIPVPVQLKWAGDTPVITLDKVSVPGLGTYSARVLIYDNTYAGTWSASDHGGMLHGVIESGSKTNAPPRKKEATR